MEPPGSDYLFNLSLLAITLVVVSTLVMVVRRMKAGTLTRMEVHLLKRFTSAGVVESIAALLPAALTLVGLTGPDLWTVASATAAVMYAVAVDQSKRRRARASIRGGAPRVSVALAIRWLPILLLFVNAVVPSVQGVGLYAAAVTLSLGAAMWSFVRRIDSVVGHNGRSDWRLGRD